MLTCDNMRDVLKKLEGGDRRSIGRANEVVEDVLNDPSLFQVAFRGMLSDDPVLRMRCADVLEKVTAQRPEYLWPHKQELIEQVAPIDQQEVRWHAAQMIARLEWHVEERAAIVDILLGYLNDESKIVRTSAMQALADLAEEHQNLRAPLTDLLQQPVETGSPAMKSRGRKLLARLGREA
jgi:HEAT repeat protein